MSNANDIIYTKVGTGPHLLFLHGFCENSTMWDDLVSDLRNKYTCIQVDLPGFGENKADSFDSIKSVAKKLNGFISRNHLSTCTLFGHSMGGYIALEMLKKQGNLFNGLSMIHSTAACDTESKMQNRRRAIAHLKTYGKEGYLKEFIKDLVDPAHFHELEPRLTSLVSSNETENMIAALKAMMKRESSLELLKNLDIPIHWAVGENDQFLEKNDLFYQASLCKLAKVSLFKNVGHLSPLESKEKCVQEIKGFLTLI